MNYKKRPIYHFDSDTSVGIDKIPDSRAILVDNYLGRTKMFLVLNKTGMTNTMTIQEAFDNKNLTLISGDYIETPIILTPTANEVLSGVVGTLTLDAFEPSYNVIAEHLNTSWEISSTSNFSNIVFSSYDDTNNLLSINTTGLTGNTQYFCRAKFKTIEFESEWSTPRVFTTGLDSIDTPTVTVQNGNTAVYETPTFLGSVYTTGGESTHLSSTWKVYRTDTNTLIWESVNDITNLTSITLPAGLLTVTTNYRVELFYKSATLTSATDTESFVTHHTFVDTPIMSKSLSVVQETEDVVITIDNYDALNTYTIGVSGGSISRLNDLITWTSPEVQEDTILTMSVTAAKNGVSSDTGNITITVLNAPVPLPVLSGPTHGVTGNTIEYIITNYDANGTYNLSTNTGTVTRTGSSIFWTLGDTIITNNYLNVSLTLNNGTSADAVINITMLSAPIEDTALINNNFSVNQIHNQGWNI